MGQYIKTTGDLVTVRPKIESAANQGRMMLDNALIEMFNIMLPIGELKTFATDEVDSWVAKMSEYGQEWCEPDGRLLKCTDYPELFALIGYNYGWSSTNPNGTYTYTFTDVDGNEKSLVIYNDLDIDGNAKLVEGNPSYFRIPNFSGRFLRSAGTASYVNKWTDSEGTERQLLTEYKAEMYKGKLDAIRDISGELDIVTNITTLKLTRFFFLKHLINNYGLIGYDNQNRNYMFTSDSARIIPTCEENVTISSVAFYLLRVN